MFSCLRPYRYTCPRGSAGFLLLPAILMAAAHWAEWRKLEPLANDLAYHAPLSRASLEGTIASEPQLRSDSVTFTLNASRLLAPRIAIVQGRVQVSVHHALGADLQPGAGLRLHGRLRLPPGASLPGGFSYRAYLQRRGIFTVMQVSGPRAVEHLPDKTSSDWRSDMARVRRHLLASMAPGLSPETAAFQGCLVLGDRASPLPEQVQREFRAVGLAAVLAASGMQVTLLLGLCLWLGRRLGASARLTAVFSAPIVVVYALLTGNPPSVQRATLVGLLVLTGRFADRALQPVSALLLAGWLIILVNPSSVYDTGLILSLLATFGVLHTAPLLAQKMTWLPPTLGQLVALPVAAQLWVLPVQIYTFETLSPLFLPANLVAAPLVEVLTYGGFATSLLGLVSPLLAGWGNMVNGILLNLLLRWAHVLASWQGTDWSMPAPPWQTVLLLYLGGFTLLEAWRADRPLPIHAWRCLGLLLLQLTLWLGEGRETPPVRVTIVAAGGTVATVIQPAGYTSMLIGGGGRMKRAGSTWDAGQSVLAPLLDHLPVNHLMMIPLPPFGRTCGGLLSLLERPELAGLWDPGGNRAAPVYRTFWEQAWLQQVPASRLWPGDIINVGPRVKIRLVEALNDNEEPFLLWAQVGTLRILWVEGIPQAWTVPSQLDLAADWLITGARYLPAALIAAVRPRSIISTSPARPRWQFTGVEVRRPAEDGPVLWEERG